MQRVFTPDSFMNSRPKRFEFVTDPVAEAKEQVLVEQEFLTPRG